MRTLQDNDDDDTRQALARLALDTARSLQSLADGMVGYREDLRHFRAGLHEGGATAVWLSRAAVLMQRTRTLRRLNRRCLSECNDARARVDTLARSYNCAFTSEVQARASR